MAPPSVKINVVRSLYSRVCQAIGRWIDVAPSLYVVGFLLIFTGVFAQSQVQIACQNGFYAIGAQQFPECWHKGFRQWLQAKGAAQAKLWEDKKERISSDYSISDARLKGLEAKLKDHSNPSFLSAREKFEEEERVHKNLEEKWKKLAPSGAQDFLIMVLIYVLIIAIFLFASFYLTKLARSYISPKMVLKNWSLSYWSFFGFPFFFLTGVLVYTSIYKAEKSWIGESSFHVSWESWVWERVANIGLCMIAAIPMAKLWCYLRKEFIPEVSVSWLRGPNGESTVEKYAQFLQIWTIVIFYGFSVITIAVIRWAASYQDEFEKAYLIITALGVIVSGLIIGKMIRNAMILRERYYQAISKNFGSWQEVSDGKIPKDPIEDFIGATWWKLPANFVGIASAMWALLELTGVSKVIVSALK